MNPDEMNGMQEEQENEEYSFLNETVKNPPIDMQKILMKLIALAGAAILFGVIAALVFYAVLTWRNSMSPNPVTIPTDEQPSQIIAGSVDGDDADGNQVVSGDKPEGISEEEKKGANGASGGNKTDGNPAAGPSDESTDTGNDKTEGESEDESGPNAPTPSPTPTPTEDELDQDALNTYARVQAKLRSIAEESLRAVVTVTGVTADDEWFDITNVGSSAASGLIVADNSVSYLVLTDISVIESAERIAVTLPDDSVVEAEFQKKDPVTGLCVISIPKSDVSGSARSSLAVATLGNSYNVSQGDSVLAVGAPTGAAGTFAFGSVVSLDESVKIVDGEYQLMITDICGGKSCSGVLVNGDGEVVGIIDQEYSGEDRHSVTAISISPLKSLIEKLSNDSALSYIGIHGLDISEKAAELQGIPSGVYVSSVEADSPALQAGVQPGDIITSVGLGTSVTLRSLHENIMNRSPGEDVEITVARRGSSKYAEFEFEILIGELPEPEEEENAAVVEEEETDSSQPATEDESQNAD